MRKLHVVFLLCLVSACVVAQPEVGKLLLGGNFQFFTGFKGAKDLPTFSINPQFGYFTGSKNAVGLSAGFSRSYLQVTPATLERMNIWQFEIFDRKYFSISDDSKLYFFLHNHVNYEFANGDRGKLSLGIKPGLAYFPRPNIGIDLSIPGLTYSNDDTDYTTLTEGSVGPNLSFNANLSNVSLGVSILINRKKKD